MCVGAEKEVKRYVPPRKGTLTLVITDGFTLKVRFTWYHWGVKVKDTASSPLNSNCCKARKLLSEFVYVFRHLLVPLQTCLPVNFRSSPS